MAEFIQLMENWEGYRPVKQNINEAALAKTIDLLTNADGLGSRLWAAKLEEAITTSNFPDLFGNVIDREMLAKYRAVTADWKSYVLVRSRPDFNTFWRPKVYGNDQRLPQVVEKGEYLVVQVGQSKYYGNLKKYGRQFDISWESMINDIMDAFGDIPDRFATAVLRTEAIQVTDLYASAAGPDLGLFGAPIVDVDLQNVTNLGALPLTIANLQTTLALMSMQVDPSGEPINVRGAHLVVPPALEFTARAILTSAFYTYAATAAAAIPLPTTNVVSQLGLKLHVDPYLPVVDASGNRNGTWYVFAEPSEGPALEADYLRGHESPEICMKASDKVTVGGGALSPFSGDFATDNIFYRVRQCFTGVRLDPRYAYAQVSA